MDFVPRKYLKTPQEAHEYLFSEQIEANIIAILPNIDGITYEEHCVDDSTAIDEVIEIAGTADIEIPEQLFEDEHEEISPAKKNCIKELGCLNKVQIFEKLFTLEFFYLLKTETIRYAAEIKNIPNYILSHENFKLFIGFIVFSSYHICQVKRATGLNVKIYIFLYYKELRTEISVQN